MPSMLYFFLGEGEMQKANLLFALKEKPPVYILLPF